MDLKIVYGYIPVHDSLEKIIENRAQEIAREIVNRTSISMKLEDQENNPKRIRKAISDKTKEIIVEMPKYLWD
jgi:hypothetical protein